MARALATGGTRQLMDWLKPIEERLKVVAMLSRAPGESPSATDMLAADARQLIAAVKLARSASTDLALGYPKHLVMEKLAGLRSGDLEIHE